MSYQGTAKLIDREGTVIDEVRVILTKENVGGLWSWGGQIDPTDIRGTDWQDTVRIRLEDGQESDAFVTDVKVSSGGTPFGPHQRGWIKGSGPAPF